MTMFTPSGTTTYTVEPQWLEHRELVYRGWFEIILSPEEILSITQTNKNVEKKSHFIMKLYVVCTH